MQACMLALGIMQCKHDSIFFCVGTSWKLIRLDGWSVCSYCTTGAQSLRSVQDGSEWKLFAKNALINRG